MTKKKNSLFKTLMQVAWLSVLLGLGMELLLLVIAACFQHSMPAQAVIADFVQKISWSTLVCSGVALGIAAGKMRPQAMGLAGFVSAPVAFYLAKMLHKSASQALAITGQVAAAGPSPFILISLKAFEYAALGFLIGRLGKNPAAGIAAHMLVGLLAGIIFGGAFIALMVSMAPEPLSLFVIISRGVNEIIFPVGCSLVLYAAQKLGEQGAGKKWNPIKAERFFSQED